MSKNVIVGTLLILIAAMLDLTQLGIGLALTGSLDFATGVIAWIPVIGQIAETASSAAGTILGATADFALSVSFGSMLITLLIYLDMFYPVTIFGGAAIEWLPFLDILPGWTVMVARCVWKKSVEDIPELGVVSAATTKNPFAIAGAAAAARKSRVGNAQPAAPANTSAAKKIGLKTQIDGIRPANDNKHIAYAS